MQLLKKQLKHLFYFLYYYFTPRRTIVLIFCSMRSGSTLLKALLAEAPDTSNLPETDYRKLYNGSKFEFYYKVTQLSPKRIIILKSPFWFTDVNFEFTIPKLNCIRLVELRRDTYPVVQSCERMIKEASFDSKSQTDLIEYWYQTYSNIQKIISRHPSTYTLTYEDLLGRPINVTHALFKFIGSKQEQGIDQYSKPKNFEWKWGSDDGGEKIKSMKVIAPDNIEVSDPLLVNQIHKNPEVQALREKFGYITN